MKKILIVDDEEKIRRIYGALLTLENYEVITAEDWEVATTIILTRKDIALILLDINLPIVDGAALYDAIRLYDQNTKVLVVSAYPIEDQKRLVMKADDYFDKSQGTDTLIQKVNDLLSGTSAKQEA